MHVCVKERRIGAGDWDSERERERERDRRAIQQIKRIPMEKKQDDAMMVNKTRPIMSTKMMTSKDNKTKRSDDFGGTIARFLSAVVVCVVGIGMYIVHSKYSHTSSVVVEQERILVVRDELIHQLPHVPKGRPFPRIRISELKRRESENDVFVRIPRRSLAVCTRIYPSSSCLTR